ncbi:MULTISPECIES: hypothetical protein [unclassified Enterococcus]|jgi:hypothetical protein|uniref:hypothetical protein n=1 Tax=unclassified Enterococcus TaxID=2608891 RepID=UPI003D290739
MLEKIKSFGRCFTKTTPFILSNTVIMIPYIVFLGLSDGFQWERIMPFVLFYTFRMTGIFLIRGLNAGLDSFTLLMISLLLGGAGSLIGVFGLVYFPLYILSSILMGLSASWLTPANITVIYHEKKQNFSVMRPTSYIYASVLLLFLLWTIRVPAPLQSTAVFALYTLFYVMAYHTVSHYPNYELDFKDVKKNLISVKELLWFGSFFLLLFLLRSSQLLLDKERFDFAVLSFAVLLVLVFSLLKRIKESWHLPLWMNLFNFMNGMFGNFLILFGTLYVSVVHGKETLAWLLYFPYIAGMVAAMIFGPAILGERSEKQLLPFLLLSFSGGLLISGMPYGFSIGIFILSFIRGTASSWLNQVYYDEEAIPADQRILAKFATQNKGSLTHQFGLMLILTAVTLFSGKPIQELLRITGRHSVTEAGIQLLEMTKWINIGMLLLGLLGIYYLWRKTAKNDEDIH